MDRRTFVMGAAAIGAAALTGGMLGGCAGGEGAEPAVGSAPALEGNLGVENYLHEAALASAPPSGAAYRDGAGNPVESLGVHEHWNNSVERLYSRDRGESEGIELVRILR